MPHFTSQRTHAGSGAAVASYLKDEDRTLVKDAGELTADYYAEGPRFDRAWGKLATRFGIERGLTRAQYIELYNGTWQGEKLYRSVGYTEQIDPDTGESKSVAHRTPGWDVTFMVPKGISELYARAATQEQADRIGEIVLASAQVAWTEALEGWARGARVKGERVTADLLGVPVLQFTARPTDATESRGAPADPHLHVHVSTMSIAGVGGKIYTFDGAAIWRTAAFRGNVFANELARGLEAEGYAIDYDDFDIARNGQISFEPAASDPEVRQHFSSNHERGLAMSRAFEEKEGRPPTNRELSAMMRISKGKKADKEMDSHPTRSRWIDDGQKAGLDMSPISPDWTHKPTVSRYDDLGERLMGPKGFVMAGSTFSADSIRPAIARASLGMGFSRAELLDYESYVMDALVVARDATDPQARYFTTQTLLNLENQITERRQALASVTGESVPRAAVRQAIRAQKFELDDEQAAAVHAGTSGSRWVNITGLAGSGKTTPAKVIVEAHRSAGTTDQVIAVAVAAKRANEFGRAIEADRWGSVESILHQISNGTLKATRDTVWLLDEAAMIDTHRMSALLEQTGNGRVILIGDDKQLSPIGPAGWYGENLEAHGSVHLTKVHRQENQTDVANYNLLREAKGTEAVKALDDRGRIHVMADKGERIQRVMQDYRVMRDKGVGAHEVRQIVQTSNQDVDLLNRFVQRDRITRGEVAKFGFTVTDTEQGRRWSINQGDQIIFLKSHQARSGDFIKNGQTGTVLSIDTEGRSRIRFQDRSVLNVNLSEREHNQSIGLAYAQHVGKMQGSEVAYVQTMPSPTHANANTAYVENTRATKEAHVYLAAEEWRGDAKEALGDAWSRREVSESAHAYLNETKRQAEAERSAEGVAEMARDSLQLEGLER